MFIGTTHEEGWLFYHDALSLMTATEYIEYIWKKGYDERWILPEHELFLDDLNRYRGRPVRNSPELCNLDSSLNKDLHETVYRHIQFTSKLDKGDPCKFSISTPKIGTSSYLRIFDPSTGVAPISERIVQDTKRLLESIKRIINPKGTIILDYNNRNGKRRVKW